LAACRACRRREPSRTQSRQAEREEGIENINGGRVLLLLCFVRGWESEAAVAAGGRG
jgi:hypothetical protein